MEEVFGFETEAVAKAHLEEMLAPWFELTPEVTCWYEDQPLKIDYVAVPKVEFPYEFFGIEVKSGKDFGAFRHYSAVLKQAIDYAHCNVFWPGLRRLGVVFVYPAPDDSRGMVRGANRLAGQFRVGMIHQNRPRFDMCGNRLWTPDYGGIANAPQAVHRIGSGVERYELVNGIEEERRE